MTPRPAVCKLARKKVRHGVLIVGLFSHRAVLCLTPWNVQPDTPMMLFQEIVKIRTPGIPLQYTTLAPYQARFLQLVGSRPQLISTPTSSTLNPPRPPPPRHRSVLTARPGLLLRRRVRERGTGGRLHLPSLSCRDSKSTQRAHGVNWACPAIGSVGTLAYVHCPTSSIHTVALSRRPVYNP